MVDLASMMIGVGSVIKWGADQLAKGGTAVLAFTQNHIANKNRELQQKAQAESLAITKQGQDLTARQLSLQENTLSFQKNQLDAQMKRDYLQLVASCMERAKDRNLQWAINQANQEFQRQIKEQDRAENRALTEFVQSVQMAINQKNIDFGIWKAQQEKELALELKKIDAALTWALREFDRQAQLDYLEARLNSEKEIQSFPILNSARQILNNSTDATLRIVYAPVTVKYTNSPGNDLVNPRFPADLLQLQVETKLSQLANFYAHQGRSVKFLCGAWNNSLFRAESAGLSLFDALGSIPFLILDAEVTDNVFCLRHSFWAMNWQDFRSYPLMPNLSWNDVQIAFAQQSAWQWLVERQAAEANGENPEEVDELYGAEQVQIFRKHLEIIQREKKALERKISLDRVDRPYQITKYDIDDSADFLAIWHCIYAGLFADEYFLLHAPVEKPLAPVFPQLFPNLLERFAVNHQQTMLQTVLNYYEIFYQALSAQGNRTLIPELRLQVMLPLVQETKFLREQVNFSMQEWLALRGISAANQDLLSAVCGTVTIADGDYVVLLNQVLPALQMPIVNILLACLHRGKLCYEQGNYDLGLTNLDQVITLDAGNGEAHFYRGLCHFGLSQFVVAITDFSQSLTLKFAEGESYFHCGRCEYELGHYDRAIANFGRAVDLGVNQAVSARELAIQVGAELRRKADLQQQAEQAKLQQAEQAKLQQAEEFKKGFVEDLGDGIELEMLGIPGNTFTMGAPKSEESSSDNERPQNPVTIQPFLMGKYPITQVQWLLVANSPKIEIDLNPNPSHFKGNNRPVENISWYDTVEFCARLSKKTGRSYRLPSEAEWECACRAGTETPFYFGRTITTNQANYNGNHTYGNSPKGQYREQTTDVGSFPANAWGLYDLHGNVWEWCADPWHDNYNGAPGDGRVWDEKDNDNRYQDYLTLGKKVKSDDRNRVLRGGSWDFNPGICRSAYRNCGNPGSRGNSLSFRVVCSVG